MVIKHSDTNLQSRILTHSFSKAAVVALGLWVPRNRAISHLSWAKDFKGLEFGGCPVSMEQRD